MVCEAGRIIRDPATKGKSLSGENKNQITAMNVNAGITSGQAGNFYQCLSLTL